MTVLRRRVLAALADVLTEPDPRRVLILAQDHPSAQYVARRLGFRPWEWQHVRDYAQVHGCRAETHRVIALPGWPDRNLGMALLLERQLTMCGLPRDTWQWEEA